MTEILLNDIERLNYRAASKWIFCLKPIDLYDFLADTGADPWGKPGGNTRAGLIDFAFEHINDVGPCILLDWVEQTGGQQ